MTLKTKIASGLGFLFLIILTLICTFAYYVGILGQESENILKNNYYSIVYSKNMLSGLDDMKSSIDSSMFNRAQGGTRSDYYEHLFESGRRVFESNLKSENSNITEIHEKEYVETLTKDYDLYLKLCRQMKDGLRNSTVYFDEFLPACERLKQSINNVYDVNMQAVVRKSELAKHDALRFTNYMAIIGTLCLVLAIFYFWYFPLYISSTLSYLSEKMRNLLKNVGITLDIKTDDEAYIILHAIGLLENQLVIKKENLQNR